MRCCVGRVVSQEKLLAMVAADREAGRSLSLANGCFVHHGRRLGTRVSFSFLTLNNQKYLKRVFTIKHFRRG